MPGSARGRAPVATMMCLACVGALALRALRRRVLRLHGLLGRLADLDLAGLGELRLAPDHVDLVLLHQKADAAVQRAGDAARALDNGADVGVILPSSVRP
jgi:hypothetical protein